jgi:hypothetical protein
VVEVPGPSSGRGGWDEFDARLPWRATRRALLAGSAVALLVAGCGEEDEAVTAPADALRRQLAAERALAAATARLPGPEAQEISTRARERAAKLVAEVGEPPDEPAAQRVAAEEAVALAQAAIVAHVVALPSLTGELRELGAEMVAGAAGDTALLADALGVAYHDAFPGTPT